MGGVPARGGTRQIDFRGRKASNRNGAGAVCDSIAAPAITSARIASTSGRGPGWFAVPLRRVSDNQPQDATRQHDLPPVVRAVGLRDRGNEKGEEGADGEASDQERLL